MDQVQKDRLLEESRQRQFGDICAKASTGVDAATLRDEVLAIGISEGGTLRGLIEHIFNAACDTQTGLAAQHTLAELCQLMPHTFEPPVPVASAEKTGPGSRGTSEKRIDFRLSLLKKCKEELEAGGKALKECRIWEEKEAKESKKLKGEDRNEAEASRAAYKRSLTCIQFCGCMYTSGVLTEKIIQSCIDQLLKADDDPRFENMEILTKLMTKIGFKFEASSKTSKDAKTHARIFDRMQEIKVDAVSKDIAKMMETVLTLRSKEWQATA
jgi:translation initiation factor 4G